MTNFEPFKMVTTIILIKGAARKTILLLLVSILSVAGCKKEKRPEPVLSQEELSTLLVEFYLAEARLGTIPVSHDSAMKLFLPFEQSLLKKKNVSEEVLKRTYRYYLDHPKEFEAVYDRVIDTLSLREQRSKQHP